ncbi:MAG: T9SS type A sorting domain-containing protein [Flavobacteriales bacterium]|nr:T9SS type A sorting domain-containing protein [Flavobacteriales bacterium]MCB9449676.1 T9SS type A sorting domain-containing protein [Flavobacteriales bacterium]
MNTHSPSVRLLFIVLLALNGSVPAFSQTSGSGAYNKLEEDNQPPPVLHTGVTYEAGTLPHVSSNWMMVTMQNTYTSAVVVATVVLPNGVHSSPAVTRVRNVGSNNFELRVQNPSGEQLVDYTVNYMVCEEGVYTIPDNGIRMEAVKVNSTETAGSGHWKLEERWYQNEYEHPVIIGQVMSENDPGWSVFWASSALKHNEPYEYGREFACGKHVGEDPVTSRNDETIGYMIFEESYGQIGNQAYYAKIGPEVVRGVEDESDGYIYPHPCMSAPGVALVSTVAMKGGNGGWPVVAGKLDPYTCAIRVSVDEDQVRDTERSHVNESVAYVVIGTSAPSKNDPLPDEAQPDPIVNVYPNPSGGSLYVRADNITGHANISIQSVNGSLVAEREAEMTGGLNAQFDLGHVPDGIYMVRIVHKGGVEVRRVVLER